MAQAQIDAVNFHLQSDTFENIHCDFRGKIITCKLNDEVSLILKWTKARVYAYIRQKNRSIKLPVELFEYLCDSKVSILFLKSYLEENV